MSSASVRERDILHEGDEFIPARAGHKIPGTERFLQQLGESDQHGVAAQVAIAIVDALEMIEIEHQQGGSNALRGGYPVCWINCCAYSRL